jgi:hypothetical protein
MLYTVRRDTHAEENTTKGNNKKKKEQRKDRSNRLIPEW